MFNIKVTTNKTYAEVNQINPLRWRILYKTGEGAFETQTGLIKCRDFFNDIVAHHMIKKQFGIYGFDNNIKFNDEGIYFHLTEIYNADQYIDNIEKALNPKLKEDTGLTICVEKETDNSVLILVPEKLWTSTYLISAVTMVLRIFNNNVTLSSWDEVFSKISPLFTVEAGVWNKKTCDYVHKWGFTLPSHLEKYWYYSGKDYNSDSKEHMNSTIHNCGAAAWALAAA